MRPPDFFASSRRFHRPSSILFPPVCCFPRRTPARPSDSASFPPAAGPGTFRSALPPPKSSHNAPQRPAPPLFPARSRPRPRNLPLRPSPAEKFPQRTAAPRSAPLFPPAAGTFRSALSPPKSPRNAPPHPAPPARKNLFAADSVRRRAPRSSGTVFEPPASTANKP